MRWLGLVSFVILSLSLTCRASRNIVLGHSKGERVGAAYFTTNHREANYIVASDIGTDGQVTLRRAVHAGGVGARAIFEPVEPGALVSQACIEVSTKSNILVTVNAGSNTLSAFKINPHDPTDIRMIGEPTSSHGEFPNSVVINKAGDMACVVNTGAVNGISCYSVDHYRGLRLIPDTIRPLGIVNQTTPPGTLAGSASQILFTEDEKQLVVSVKGAIPDGSGFYAVWDIDNGSISKNFTRIPVPKGGLLPFGMTVIPEKNAILVTDATLGYEIFDLAEINGSTENNRSAAYVIEGQREACWSALSPSTGNIYIGDSGISVITEVHIDDNLNPTIIKQYPQPQFSSSLDIDIGSIGKKDYLYILAANATAIDVRYLNGPGYVTNIQRMDFSCAAHHAGIPIDPLDLEGMTVFIK